MCCCYFCGCCCRLCCVAAPSWSHQVEDWFPGEETKISEFAHLYDLLAVCAHNDVSVVFSWSATVIDDGVAALLHKLFLCILHPFWGLEFQKSCRIFFGDIHNAVVTTLWHVHPFRRPACHSCLQTLMDASDIQTTCLTRKNDNQVGWIAHLFFNRNCCRLSSFSLKID